MLDVQDDRDNDQPPEDGSRKAAIEGIEQKPTRYVENGLLERGVLVTGMVPAPLREALTAEGSLTRKVVAS